MITLLISLVVSKASYFTFLATSMVVNEKTGLTYVTELAGRVIQTAGAAVRLIGPNSVFKSRMRLNYV